MHISSTLDQLQAKAKQNIWLRRFTVVTRVALAIGFVPAGMVKISGERFTSLSNNHPMGHYLEALFHTGYYYTFIGIFQVIAGLLLLIPVTATLGAILYLPIIVNICILSLSVRFDGSLLSSPLMVVANLYLLCWDYDKLKVIFFQPKPVAMNPLLNEKEYSTKFPKRFFAGVLITIAAVVLFVRLAYDVKPRNTLSDCRSQFNGTNRTKAGYKFCDCIHKKGEPLNKSLDEYHNSPDDENTTR